MTLDPIKILEEVKNGDIYGWYFPRADDTLNRVICYLECPKAHKLLYDVYGSSIPE